MTKFASPLTNKLALSLVTGPTEVIVCKAWEHARKMEADRARLIEALEILYSQAKVTADFMDHSRMEMVEKLLRELEAK